MTQEKDDFLRQAEWDMLPMSVVLFFMGLQHFCDNLRLGIYPESMRKPPSKEKRK